MEVCVKGSVVAKRGGNKSQSNLVYSIGSITGFCLCNERNVRVSFSKPVCAGKGYLHKYIRMDLDR